MPDDPFRDVTEADAMEAGLLEQPDTTYRRDDDGVHRGYNVGTRKRWRIGAQLAEADLDIGGLPRDRGPVADAIAKAQAVLNAELEAIGGRVLCSVILVHADGVEPSGGLDAWGDDEHGPQDPEDLMMFALTGMQALARRYGLPFAVLNSGAIGGQG
jgi:hypothetical protein